MTRGGGSPARTRVHETPDPVYGCIIASLSSAAEIGPLPINWAMYAI